MKKRSEIVVEVRFRGGSKFQDEFFKDVIGQSLVSLKIFMSNKHKNNKFSFNIEDKN